MAIPPDPQTPPEHTKSVTGNPLLRTERRLKVADFFALIMMALIAMAIMDHKPAFRPQLLISLGLYQVIISGLFLLLVWRKRRQGIHAGQSAIGARAGEGRQSHPRLWQRVTRRLPYQLDYVFRALAGIALVAWGTWLLLRS